MQATGPRRRSEAEGGRVFGRRMRGCSRKRQQESEKYVFGRRKENACAAGFTPYTMISAVGLGPDVIAGIKLLVIDHQLAVKQIQFFRPGMAVRVTLCYRRGAHQHADAVFLRVGRE